MNKRIKDLALQSDWKSDRLTAVNAEEQDRKLQKFAELIVRECASLCANLKTTYAGGTNMSPEEIAKDTAESLAEIIKEHFGVE